MAKTVLFEKRNGEIKNKVTVLSSLENIFKLLANGEYILNVKKQASKRSLNQNALMWMWFACIENELGQEKEDIHDHYCKKFLKREIEICGVRELVVSGTKNLTIEAMSNFMNKVQADAASEFGIILPVPEDLAFEEFKNQYKQFTN